LGGFARFARGAVTWSYDQRWKSANLWPSIPQSSERERPRSELVNLADYWLLRPGGVTMFHLDQGTGVGRAL
jgi:hypothetical protein